MCLRSLLQVVKRDGSLAWSPVYLFPHFQTSGERAFVRITTESNATVRTTAWLALLTVGRSPLTMLRFAPSCCSCGGVSIGLLPCCIAPLVCTGVWYAAVVSALEHSVRCIPKHRAMLRRSA
jgi:hypothetical protein